MTYDPKAWQRRHPIGTLMVYGGLFGTGTGTVRVGRAYPSGVRVRFPKEGWQTVHPDDLKPR